MADSKRLVVLKALTTFLETEVSVLNGYDFDLLNAVFRGRPFFDTEDPVPMVSLRDNLNPDRFPSRAGDDDGAAGEANSEWVLLVQGWAKAGDGNAYLDNAENLMANVKKALAKLDDDPPPSATYDRHPSYLLGGLIERLRFEPGVVRPAEQNSSVADFWLRVSLKFTENVRDPFDLG